MKALRARLYRQLDPLAWEGSGMSPLNSIVLLVVVVSIVAVVCETEPTLRDISPGFFKLLNLIFAVAFSIEYVIRLWAMGHDPRYAGLKGKFRYAATFASVLDLVATAALWVDILFGLPGTYGVMLRLARALRVLTLTRNSPMSKAIRLLIVALRMRSLELTLSFGFAMVILLIASTTLYWVEGDIQPDQFGSIPRAMWWAIATLTTVGYGDVYPITPLGKICSGVVVLMAIAIVAMPTGIMAAAFSDAFQDLRENDDEEMDV